MEQKFEDFIKSAIDQEYWSLADYASETDSTSGKKGKNTLRFASMGAMIQAAWNFVEFYKGMHEKNLLYKNDLRKVLYFHFRTGKMIFTDWRNFSKADNSIGEEDLCTDYCAPEVILGKTAEYSDDTENWSLAVYLYELFFHSGNPLKGKDSFSQVFLKKEDEYKWYAENGIFTMEDNLCKNRAVHGVQDRLIKYWELYPQILRDAFTEVFVDGKEDASKRKSPEEWEKVLNVVKTEYITCNCGNSGFIHDFMVTPEGHYRCKKCNNVFYVFESGVDKIYLTEGTKIFGYQLYKDETLNDQCVGMVVENRQKKGVFGIKNMSNVPWKGLYPDGEEKIIAPGGGIPLWRGLRIAFSENCIWNIKGDKNNG